MIDTRSIHEQLLDQCQQELTAGKWRTGERFPSERELASRHRISRATANKVLARLISEGWIGHRRGIGCFVEERPTLFASLQQLESFTGFAEKLGKKSSTRVLLLKTGKKGNAMIRTQLDLKTGEPLIQLERMRELDGQAVIYERRWLPGVLFPNCTRKMFSGSFYRLCRETFGIRITGEDLRIRITGPEVSAPVDWISGSFAFYGTGCHKQNQPVWYQEVFYRGESFELKTSTHTATPYPEFSLVYRGTPQPKETL